MRTLLFGESFVDLFCPTPAATLAGAETFAPRLAGAAARIATSAAQAGAEVAVAGVVGDDAWGAWIRERLQAAGVDVDHLALDAAATTPLTFTTFDAAGAVAIAPHGAPIPQALDAADVPGALLLTAGTLATDDERASTLTARDRAIDDGRPVIVALVFEPHRWETPAFAASASRELVKGAFLVVAGGEEARLVSGEEERAAAADGLVAMGAHHAVVTGSGGATLRGGGLRLDVRGAADPDELLGLVLAQLAATDFYAPAIAAALPRAVAPR